MLIFEVNRAAKQEVVPGDVQPLAHSYLRHWHRSRALFARAIEEPDQWEV